MNFKRKDLTGINNLLTMAQGFTNCTKDAIRKNYCKLKESLANPDDVAEYLLSKDVLTYSLMEEVKAEKTTGKMTSKLLDILLRRSESVVGVFSNALVETGNRELSKTLSEYVNMQSTEGGNTSPSVYSHQQRIPNLNCESCSKRNADSYKVCIECKYFYCRHCSELHTSAFAEHTILTVSPNIATPMVMMEQKLTCSSLTRLSFNKEGGKMYGGSETRSRVGAEHEEESGRAVGGILPIATVPSAVRFDSTRFGSVWKRRFSVKRYDIFVRGILSISDRVLVIEGTSKYNLKIYDNNGTYLSSTLLEDAPESITRVSDDTFATCSHKVNVWNIDGNTVKQIGEFKYKPDYFANGIDYNGTCFCVLHSDDSVVTILDKQGRQISQIPKVPFEKELEFGCDIHMDKQTHNIYVPCWGDNSGILCMSLEGKKLWFTTLSADLCGITEIRGMLCVADRANICLHLMSKSGYYEGVLLNTDDVMFSPDCMHYDNNRNELYVSYNSKTDFCDVVTVFSII